MAAGEALCQCGDRWAVTIRIYKVTPGKDIGNRAIAVKVNDDDHEDDDDGDAGTDLDESHVQGITNLCDGDMCACGDADTQDELLSETFAPMTFEEALRASVRHYDGDARDGGQMFLDALDAARLGMYDYEYRQHVEAQAKKAKEIACAERKLAKAKAKAIARAEAKLAKLKAQ